MKVVIPGLTTGKARAFRGDGAVASKGDAAGCNVGSGGITFVAPALSIVTVGHEITQNEKSPDKCRGSCVPSSYLLHQVEGLP